MPTTSEVLDQHLTSFGRIDLDAILADYASDAVLFTPTEAMKGPEAMKPFFENLLSEFAKPGASFAMRQRCVEGEYAYILWDAETADHFYEAATDTFVVRDGKILAQSFAAKILPRS